MKIEKEYFIHLLSCFLNCSQPEGKQIDWNEIYALAEAHNVQGIIANEVKMLPGEFQPNGKMKSYFNQHIGLTVQDFAKKEIAKERLIAVLNENEIDHLIVKGASLQKHYPEPELRTSGDIDAIVRKQDYKKAVALLKNIFPNSKYTAEVLNFKIFDTAIELHSTSNVETKYFDDIFEHSKHIDKHTYELDNYDHLLYVLCHLCHHIKYTGAGIRMLMDIDVLVRAINNFDQVYFEEMCKKAGFEKSWSVISSLSRLWFNTPINAKYPTLDEGLIKSFERVMLDGGVFGFNEGTLGGHYVANSIENGEKAGLLPKFKALLLLFFPSVKAIKNNYSYASKSRLLIPIAYLNRIFDGVFKRFNHSVGTIKEIAHSNDYSAIQADLMNELNIK